LSSKIMAFLASKAGQNRRLFNKFDTNLLIGIVGIISISVVGW
jgi:hypothetical protein